MDYNVSFSVLCESFGWVKNQFKLVEQFGTNGLSVVLAEEKRKQRRCGQGSAGTCVGVLCTFFSPNTLDCAEINQQCGIFRLSLE